MDIDQKWLEVKAFYESSYKKKNGLPIRFQRVPSDEMIRYLYDQMKKLGVSLGGFYQKDIGLLHRLESLRGQCPRDPLKKRSPFE